MGDKSIQKKFLYNLLGQNQLLALHSQGLDNLDLRNRQVSPNDVETLLSIAVNDSRRPLMSLQTIRLSFNKIQSYGVERLTTFMCKGNITLTSLDLGFNDICDNGAKALSKILLNNNIYNDCHTTNSLKILYLSGNKISDNGFKELGKALQVNNTLEELHISANHGSIHGAEALAFALRKNTKLKVLKASANNFTENGCRALLSIFSENSTLEVLDISNNDVGDACLFTFGISVASAITSLTHLDLSFGNIGCTGMEYLVNSLQYCKNLKFLELKKNSIADTGAIALAKYLEKAKLTDTLGLRSLGLGFNDINADGITAIVKALTPNHLIQTLSIRGNIINAQVVKDIGEMLRLDHGLTHVHLEHLLNCAGEGGERYLAAAIASNSKCKLKSITGFDLSRALLQVGSPQEMQGLSNEACLKMLQDMWQGKGINNNNNNSSGSSSGSSSSSNKNENTFATTSGGRLLSDDIAETDIDNPLKSAHQSVSSMAVLASNPSRYSKMGWIEEDGAECDDDDSTIKIRKSTEEEREKLSISMSHLTVSGQKLRSNSSNIAIFDDGIPSGTGVNSRPETVENERNASIFDDNPIIYDDFNKNDCGDRIEVSNENYNVSGKGGLITKAEKRPRSSGLLFLPSIDNAYPNSLNNIRSSNITTKTQIRVNDDNNDNTNSSNPSSTTSSAFVDGIAATMASHEFSNSSRVLSIDGLHGAPVELVQALAQIEKEQFSPSDLWRLDQYYFSPDPQLLLDQVTQNASSSSSSSSSSANIPMPITSTQMHMESQSHKVMDPLTCNEISNNNINTDNVESESLNEGTSPPSSATTSNATDSVVSTSGGTAVDPQQQESANKVHLNIEMNMNTNTNTSYDNSHHAGSPQAKRLRSELVEYDGNNKCPDRLSRYPRLKFFLENLKSTADETRVLCILRQLKYIEEYNGLKDNIDNGTNNYLNKPKMDTRNIQSILLEIFHS